MAAPALVNRPVYLQVRDILVDRISSGGWKPGKIIPSEGDLAREYGVSCGTVRKALAILEEQSLITRRQGRGTFVNDPVSDASTLRFAKLHGPDGNRICGTVKFAEVTEAKASEEEAERLDLPLNAKVYRIKRVRFVGDMPSIYELATVPADQFPGLSERRDVAQGIYSIAQHYGHIIGRAEERITVAAAPADVADALSLVAGTPVAVLDRLVQTIADAPVEWRTAWCQLRENYYLVTL